MQQNNPVTKCLKTSSNKPLKHTFRSEISLKSKTDLTHIALYLSRDSCAALVNDGINLLHHVEVSFVIGVLDAGPSPWDV